MTASVRASRARLRSGEARARRRARPATAVSARLQRKAGSCACGGGCPRCATESSAGGLTIGAVDDPLEREADRVAEQVMAMRDPAARASALPAAQGELLQRQPMEEEEEELQAKPEPGADGLLQRQAMEEEEEMLQPKEAASATAGEPDGVAFGAAVESLRGGGSQMGGVERSFFEPRFGRDFGGVRVHTGAQADRLTRDVGALAFTVGGDIAFRSGAYRPDSNAGKTLIAHELTHVVQQGAAPDGEADADHGG